MCTDSRLWKDIKTHKYVQALKEHEEFHSFLDQKGSNGKSVARLVCSDPNAKTQVNAAMTGSCFNCKGPHLSKTIDARPIIYNPFEK